ncbi:hypothetical protein Tco_0045459 [Tanacetum coccineum]
MIAHSISKKELYELALALLYLRDIVGLDFRPFSKIPHCFPPRESRPCLSPNVVDCLVIDIFEKLLKSRQTLSKAMVARNGFSQPNHEAKNSTAIHEGASGKSRASPYRREGPRKVKSSASVGVE